MAVANTKPEVKREFLNEYNMEDASEIPDSEPLTDLDVISVKREDVRGKLALAFVIGFFAIILVGMIIAALNQGDKVASVRDILLAISGVLSGPLGFVIGYYFHSKEDSKK